MSFNPGTGFSPSRKMRKWMRKQIQNEAGSQTRYRGRGRGWNSQFQTGVANQQFTGGKPVTREYLKPASSAFQSICNQYLNSTSQLGTSASTAASETSNQLANKSVTNINLRNEQIVQFNSWSSETKIDSKSPFPGLIIFHCFDKHNRRDKFLKQSFEESPYGPLKMTFYMCGRMFKITYSVGELLLGEGVGETKPEAQQHAVVNCVKKLRTTNYFIEAKRDYLPSKKTFPDFLLNVDASQSHVYKVVYLKSPNGPDFRYPIQGAVDYVSSEAELLKYIENHGNGNSKADLFIFNIEKSQRHVLYPVCRKAGMQPKPLVGCSNGAILASFPQNPREIFEELNKCGGETVKYRLLPPGSTEVVKIEDDSSDEESETGANPPTGGFLKPASGAFQSVCNQYLSSTSQLESSVNTAAPTATSKISHQQATNSVTNIELRNEQMVRFNSWSSETKIDSTGPFPGLVIFRGFDKPNQRDRFMEESFENSPYGPLNIQSDMNGSFFKVSYSVGGILLGEGQGHTKQVAQHLAVLNCVRKLRTTNYFIEAKLEYLPTLWTFPDFLRNVDSSHRHIFKVVYFRRPNGPVFRYPIHGTVDYVSSEAELAKYIENHGKDDSKADLFILNIEKSQCQVLYPVFTKLNMHIIPLVGCANRGILAIFPQNPRKIFEELKKCGGETVKYRLLPPGSDTELVNIEDEYSDKHFQPDEQEQETPGQNTSSQQDNIVISHWIADNLVIMEDFSQHGTSCIAPPSELILNSVRNTPTLGDFIIEKKKDKVTELITGEALIDRQVVGRAQAYTENLVKTKAGEDAMERLRKYCYFIEIKRSYSGINGEVPSFLAKRIPSKDNIYRIVSPREVPNVTNGTVLSKLLTQFLKSPFEDLFFLDDFPLRDLEVVFQKGKQRRLLTRQFGSNCVCIYKKKRPKDVLSMLLSTSTKENEKYKLHEPVEKLNCDVETLSELKVRNLFDFDQDTQFKGAQSTSTQQMMTTPLNKVPLTNPVQRQIPIGNEMQCGRNDNKPHERHESTSTQQRPVALFQRVSEMPDHGTLTGPRQRSITTAEGSMDNGLMWERQHQIPKEGLWQRRNVSSVDRRPWEVDERECKLPKLSSRNGHFVDLPYRDQSWSKGKINDQGKMMKREQSVSPHGISSSLREPNSRAEASSSGQSTAQSTVYDHELDVWMETESDFPNLSSSFLESQKVLQPKNDTKRLFDLQPDNKKEEQQYLPKINGMEQTNDFLRFIDQPSRDSKGSPLFKGSNQQVIQSLSEGNQSRNKRPNTLQERMSGFSNLFDMDKASGISNKQAEQDFSRRECNIPNDRITNLRNNTTVDKQQTGTLWEKDIKRMYDQRQPVTDQERQPNFRRLFDVSTSQGPWNAPHQFLHNTDRIRKSRGHSFSKIAKYGKQTKR